MADQPSDTFDPFNQVVTVLAPDGTTPIPIPLAFIQQVQSNTIAMGIVQGTQLGAAALLLVCLFLITKKDKLRSLLFILNAVALFLVVIRGIVSGIGFTGPFFDWYRFSTQYYANTDHAKAVSVAADLLTLLLTIVIEMSVLLQVRIVCCTLEPIWRHAVNVSNTLMAAVVIGMRLAVSTLTIKWNILGVQHETEWQFEHLTKFAKASNIAFIVSIGISVTVFCGKLAFAIHRRRSMGMKQFGSMQVVLIMGCQTMILPFVFLIITCFGLKTIQLQSFGAVLIALCLPLSGMWASAANTSNVHIADARLPMKRADYTSSDISGTTVDGKVDV